MEVLRDYGWYAYESPTGEPLIFTQATVFELTARGLRERSIGSRVLVPIEDQQLEQIILRETRMMRQRTRLLSCPPYHFWQLVPLARLLVTQCRFWLINRSALSRHMRIVEAAPPAPSTLDVLKDSLQPLQRMPPRQAEKVMTEIQIIMKRDLLRRGTVASWVSAKAVALHLVKMLALLTVLAVISYHASPQITWPTYLQQPAMQSGAHLRSPWLAAALTAVQSAPEHAQALLCVVSQAMLLSMHMLHWAATSFASGAQAAITAIAQLPASAWAKLLGSLHEIKAAALSALQTFLIAVMCLCIAFAWTPSLTYLANQLRPSLARLAAQLPTRTELYKHLAAALSWACRPLAAARAAAVRSVQQAYQSARASRSNQAPVQPATSATTTMSRTPVVNPARQGKQGGGGGASQGRGSKTRQGTSTSQPVTQQGRTPAAAAAGSSTPRGPAVASTGTPAAATVISNGGLGISTSSTTTNSNRGQDTSTTQGCVAGGSSNPSHSSSTAPTVTSSSPSAGTGHAQDLHNPARQGPSAGAGSSTSSPSSSITSSSSNSSGAATSTSTPSRSPSSASPVRSSGTPVGGGTGSQTSAKTGKGMSVAKSGKAGMAGHTGQKGHTGHGSEEGEEDLDCDNECRICMAAPKEMVYMHQESCAIKFWSLCEKSICRACAVQAKKYNSPCPICNRPGLPIEASMSLS